MEDLALLGVMPPTATLRVSEHVPDIIEFIAGIERRRIAYVIPATACALTHVHLNMQMAWVASTASLAQRLSLLRDSAASSTDDAGAAGKRDARDFALKLSPPHSVVSADENQLDAIDIPPGWPSQGTRPTWLAH